MSAQIIESEAARLIRPIADAWGEFLRGGGGGVVDADEDGRPIVRYATFTGEPLRPLTTDAGEGEVVGISGDEAVRARGRRWDVAEDIGLSMDEVSAFVNMKAGMIPRSRAALSTGCNLAKVGSLDELRDRLRDPRDGDKWAIALSPAKLDDAPGLFIASELMISLPEVVRVERLMPYGRQIFPMAFLNAPGAESYRFTVLDEYGDAMWTSNFDGEVPMVGQKRKQVRRPLEYLWMGAEWGLRELLQWQQARANGARLPEFSTERPRIAREALLRAENMWLWFGGPKNSYILGLFSPENGIPKAAPVAHWSTLSPEANLALVQGMITAIRQNFIEVPDTILMPVGQYDFYATMQWPNTDKMLLDVMMASLRKMGIKEIVAVPECTHSAALEAKLKAKKYSDEDAARYAGGVDGLDAMVVLSRRPEKIRGVVSQDVRALPPEVRPVKTSVTLLLASGGLEVRYPNAHRIQPFNPP